MARSAGKKTTSTKKTTVEKKTYLCPYCGKTKKEDDFYVSTDPRIITGRTSMCRECVQKIAFNWDENRQAMGTPTKKSVMDALEYIDRPFLENLWTSSYNEWLDPDAKLKRKSIWDAYIKNVSMNQYNGLRWRDGDIFQTYIEDAKNVANIEAAQSSNAQLLGDQEVNTEFEKNKSSVIRLLGYDPFLSEKPEDQPLLYSQLVGYLDAGGDSNEDMMRTSSAITIVRGFLQQAKLDDKLAKVMANTSANPTEMKTLLDAKKSLGANISKLAEDSCLSLKHNKNASKGENTWTGKIKKLKDMDLRDAEVNGFDIGTCRGMQQALEISDMSILKALALDESEWSEVVADQRKLLVDTQRERDVYKEINRILLRENLDLRDTLEEHDLLDKDNLKNLKDLFSPFGEAVSQDNEESDEDE